MNYPPEVGSRIELAPHTDAWMRGARYGTVKDVTSGKSGAMVFVKLDKAPKRLTPLRPADIAKEIQP